MAAVCTSIPNTQHSAANKRVTQLRRLASIIRHRTMSCNKWPEGKLDKASKLADDDPALRPRTYSSTIVENGTSKYKQRSIRKQRYYGSSDLMIQDSKNDLKSVGGFRLEPAESVEGDVYSGDNELPTNPVMLENPEVETRWYIRHFLGREHQNFAGVDNQKSPYFLSVLIDEELDGTSRCRAILWQCTGAKKLIFPYHATQKPLTAKHVIQKFPGMNDLHHSLKEISDPRLQKDLLLLEEQEGAVNFKFGLIYSLHNQKTDDAMFSNENGSETFQQFAELLGEKVQLQGWTKFRGGLDTKTNSTGQYSYYTLYEGHEVMFHVSTLLPFSTENRQQLERKRHIGNDIVNIIFQDGGDPKNLQFNPAAMKSQFTHIFAVVTYDWAAEIYRLWVFSEETVPAYGPALPNPAEFHCPQQFKQFLLTKVINGEKAAFRNQVFTEKRRRTTDALIKDMYLEYLKKELNKGTIPKMTEIVIRHLRSPRNKDFDHNLLEFLQVGEHLKLTKSLNGEAPNLLTVNHLYRKQPWEPQFLSSELPYHDYIASDSWSNRTLLLVNEELGTLSVNEAVTTTVFDQNCTVQQISVLENFGILIVRCEQGKESYLSVFSLQHLRCCIRSGKSLQKKDSLDNKIQHTKGCQYYALTGNQSFRLSMVFSIGKKLYLYKWNLSQITQPSTSTDIADHFEIIKEINLSDDPLSLCLFESGVQANIKAAVATKYGIDIVDFNESVVLLLYRNHLPKGALTSLIASTDVSSEEILLTFHNTTLVFDLCEKDCQPMPICWNTNPNSIAYCFPYVLAFGSDTIEIRLAVNGNLFGSIFLPKVHLLTARDDIFFTTEEAISVSSCNNNNMFGNNNNRSTSPTNNHRTASPKPTSQPKFLSLYKIPVKNLLKADSSPSPSKNGRNCRSPAGGTSPVPYHRPPAPSFNVPETMGCHKKLISPVFTRKEYILQHASTHNNKSHQDSDSGRKAHQDSDSGRKSHQDSDSGRSSVQGGRSSGSSMSPDPNDKSSWPPSPNGDISDVLL